MKETKVTIEFASGEKRDYTLSDEVTKSLSLGDLALITIQDPRFSETFTARPESKPSRQKENNINR